MTQKVCVRHGTPTNLACNRCEQPACQKCLVWTEVGQKCRTCVYPNGDPRVRSRRVRAGGAVALVVVVAVGVYVSSRPGEESRDVTTAPAAEPGIGADVVNLGLTFVVTEFGCNGKQLEGGGPAALGRYCLLKLRATNTGARPVTFQSLGQFLLDESRRRYAPDPTATLFLRLNRDAPPSPTTQQLNPGGELATTLVYDVPDSVQPVRAELHGRPGPGATVRLDRGDGPGADPGAS